MGRRRDGTHSAWDGTRLYENAQNSLTRCPPAQPGCWKGPHSGRGPKGSERTPQKSQKSPQGNPGLPTSGGTGFLRRFRAGFRKVARRTGIPSLTTASPPPRKLNRPRLPDSRQSKTRANHTLNRSPPPSPDFPPHKIVIVYTRVGGTRRQAR